MYDKQKPTTLLGSGKIKADKQDIVIQMNLNSVRGLHEKKWAMKETVKNKVHIKYISNPTDPT